MKHPFMVTWIGDDGKYHSSSFTTSDRRDSVAKSKLEQGYTVYVSDQMQLGITDEVQPSTTYDPRYEIPF